MEFPKMPTNLTRGQMIMMAVATLVLILAIVLTVRYVGKKDKMCSSPPCATGPVAMRPDREICDGNTSHASISDLAHVAAAGGLDEKAACQLDELAQHHLTQAGRGPLELDSQALSAGLARRAAVREGMTGGLLFEQEAPVAVAGIDAILDGDAEAVCVGSACALVY